MKKFYYSWAFGISISLIAYLIIAFYKWDFYNPISWLASMHKWAGGYRIIFLIEFALYILETTYWVMDYLTPNIKIVALISLVEALECIVCFYLC